MVDRMRMMRFLVLSAMLHFTFAVVSQFVFDANPRPAGRTPISVRIIKSRPEPNPDMETGIIKELPPVAHEEEPPEDAKILSAFNAREHAPKVYEKILHRETATPKKKIVIPDKRGEPAPKTRPQTAVEPEPADRLQEKPVETVRDDRPNPFVKTASLENMEEPAEAQKVKYKKELEKLSVEPEKLSGVPETADNLEEKPQEGAGFLDGEDVDNFIKNNPSKMLETKDELVVSLNTRKFKYMA